MTSSTMATWPAANNRAAARGPRDGERAAHVACRSATSSAVCDGVSRTRRTSAGAQRDLEHASRVTRERRAWLKPRSRRRANAAARAPAIWAAARPRSRTACGQQHAEHARVGDDAVVLELADQVVDRRFEAQRAPARRGECRGPGQVGVAEAAEVEVERGARESAQAAARRKQRGREERAKAPRRPSTASRAQSVDNGFRGSRTCPRVSPPAALRPAGKLMQINR